MDVAFSYVSENEDPDDDPVDVRGATHSTNLDVIQVKDGLLNPLLYVSYGGNVGIGTSSATSKLHVYATQSGAFRLQDTTQGNGYILRSDANGVGTWTASSSIYPYKIYSALLSQSGALSPTAIELENTLGITATFSYIAPGYYELHMSGKFTSGKTFIINGWPDQDAIGGDFGIFITTYFNSSIVLLKTYDFSGTSTPSNGLLNNTSIEIRVYP